MVKDLREILKRFVTIPHCKVLRHTAAPLLSSPHQITPQDTTAHYVTPHFSSPRQTTPAHHVTPHCSAPRIKTSDYTAAHENSPHHTAAHDSSPSHTTLQLTTPRHTVGHHGSPRHLTRYVRATHSIQASDNLLKTSFKCHHLADHSPNTTGITTHQVRLSLLGSGARHPLLDLLFPSQ